MRRLMVVGILTALFMSGCSGSDEHEQQSNDGELPAGYSGGCERGFAIYSQNQFAGAGGGYGTLVRSTLEGAGQGAGLLGNDKLTATGWLKTGELIYPDNPEGIRGEVWYYVPQLPNGGAGWVADAGVRAVATEPAPDNRSKFYEPKSQAAPQPLECELSR